MSDQTSLPPLGIKARLVLDEVELELRHALSLHPPMHSFHEGYSVILEELDELWDEIKLKPLYRNPDALRKEALQVAAMAVRFVLDTLPAEQEF